MKLHEAIDKLAPDWTHRRVYIKFLLIFLCTIISLTLGSAVALGITSKFTLYVSGFMIVFAILSFMVLLGIIGSYIFSASWSNSDFLKVLPGIIPHMVPEVPVQDYHDPSGQNSDDSNDNSQ